MALACDLGTSSQSICLWAEGFFAAASASIDANPTTHPFFRFIARVRGGFRASPAHDTLSLFPKNSHVALVIYPAKNNRSGKQSAKSGKKEEERKLGFGKREVSADRDLGSSGILMP